MEKGTKIKRITIKRERNEDDPCGIDMGLMEIISVVGMRKSGLGIRFVVVFWRKWDGIGGAVWVRYGCGSTG